MNHLDRVIGFYEGEGDEDLRLQPGGAHFLEYTTAMRYLLMHLPKGGKVLDSCAGTGAYAFALAGEGFPVTAGDIVPFNVETMRKKQHGRAALSEIYEGNALYLSGFGDGAFDGVLCMGALYHLPDEADRIRAVAEGLRVLRPGGVFAATYMNRYAVILNNSGGDLDNLDEILMYARDGLEGVFFASTPRETEKLMDDRGLEKLCHIALDGVVNFLHGTAGVLSHKGADRWSEFHKMTCEDPSLLGYSYHNLYIGRKAL